MTRFAFVFPGQGIQKVGMLSNIWKQYPIIENTFRESSSILGYDFCHLVQQGPIKELNKTWRTQPVILTASVAIWRIWQENSNKIPRLMAGHSLGEYSALVCSGVINFADALRLVENRGKFMQETVSEGTGLMAAVIGLDNISVTKICEESAKNQVVSPVSFNSLKQTIIGGHKEAVKRARAACKAAGAKRVLYLPISVPSHCILMLHASKKLAIELKKINFHKPKIPVINNVDVKCETEAEAIRKALVRQLYNPVQWVKIIKYMSDNGIKHLYEIGPSSVLTAFTNDIVDNLTSSSLNKLDTLSAAFM